MRLLQADGTTWRPRASPENASAESERGVEDHSKDKPDDLVRTAVATLSDRAAIRPTNAYAVQAEGIVLSH